MRRTGSAALSARVRPGLSTQAQLLDFRGLPMTIESLVSRPELSGSQSAGNRLAAWFAGTWRSAVAEALRSARVHILFTGLIALYVAAELYLPALMGVETPFTPTFGYRFFLMMSAATLAFPA